MKLRSFYNKYALLPRGACKYKGGQKINILTILTFYTDQRKKNQSKKHVGLKKAYFRPTSGS